MDYLESKGILKQAIFDEKLVIFVGAGVSKQSGIPLWGDVVKTIHDKLEKTFIDEKEYLKIPQLYFNSRGKKEYNELVRRILKHDDRKPNEIHDLIVRLNPCNVITTNYDDLLERAFRSNGEFLEVVERDSDIPYVRNSRMIIKMHGGFIHDNFVLKEDDYLNYSTNFPLIETYIKALIAKNVVLFIGYSYNDPDVKQIINWTKHILGRDFQRAYLLDVDNEFDVANTDYYKNLGVNVLYAKELFSEPEYMNNPGKTTSAFLNFIIEDTEETDILTSLYNDFSSYKNLNYVLSKYIIQVFSEYGSVYFHSTTLIILDSIIAEALKGKNVESNNGNVGIKKTAREIENDKKREFICSILRKSMISYVVHQTQDISRNNDEIIFDFTDSDSEDVFFDYINKQNYTELGAFVDSVNLYDEKLTTSTALKIALSLYYLKDYTNCFFILNRVASELKQKQDYIWYFIAEFNRVNLSKTWLLDEQMKKEASEIDLEGILAKIDLESILAKNALREKRRNKFLKQLLDSSLIYSALIDVSKKHEKVEQETKTIYSIMSSSAVNELELNALDLYNYLQYNFLMLDFFAQVKEIYKHFISAMFCAHSAKKKTSQDNDFFFLDGGSNVVLNELSAFAIIIMSKFLDKKSLKELISKHNVSEIKLDKEAEVVLFEIFQNLNNAFKNRMLNAINRENVIVLLILLRYVKLSKERFLQVMIIIDELIDRAYFCHNEIVHANEFVVFQYNHNKESINENSLVKVVESLIALVSKDKSIDTNSIKQFLSNACIIVNKLNNATLINDNSVETILLNSQYTFLASVYIIASESAKLKIRQALVTYFTNNAFNSSLYEDAVRHNALDPSPLLEDKMLAEINKLATNKNNGLRVIPDPLENAISDCINLYLNDQLINIEEFSSIFISSSDKVKFLYDMDNFDYSTFKLTWMQSDFSNSAVKKKISENPTAKAKIKELYKSAFSSNDYDERMVSDYFEYFE